jgi:hypothetical protein
MNVMDRLAGGRSAVSHDAVTLFPDPLITRDLGCHPDKIANGLVVFRANVVQGRVVRSGHQHDVHRRLWVDVAKSNYLLVLMDDIRPDLARRDLAENAVSHFSHLPAVVVR